MLKNKKIEACATPQIDDTDALMYLHATLHYPKNVREEVDREAERRHLKRITAETLKKDPDGLEIAFSKLALMKAGNNTSTIRQMAEM